MLFLTYLWYHSFLTWLMWCNSSWAACLVWYDWFMCVTWLIHVCDMTYSCVWHDSLTCVIWLIHMCDMTHSCVTWLIHMWDMTHSYVGYDSFICVTWLIHMCDMTHSYVRHDSFSVTWLVWHDSFMRNLTLLLACHASCVIWLFQTWHASYHMKWLSFHIILSRNDKTSVLSNRTHFGVTWEKWLSELQNQKITSSCCCMRARSAVPVCVCVCVCVREREREK